MAEPLAHRCALEAAARGEPLAGTASRVGRWLVVEQPGAWGHDALGHSHLDPDIGRALADTARAAGVRVLLARRPGWGRASDVRRVFLAHTAPGSRWLRQVDLPMEDEAALLALDLRALARGEPPGVGEPGPASLVLVCTHGRHDPCCADQGRPIVRRFAAVGVPDVWECSHVGGDRYAANLVALPHGLYYAHVTPQTALGLVTAYERGEVDPVRLRGRSAHAAPAQAAQHYARLAFGDNRLDALRPVGMARLDERTWRVRLAAPGGGSLLVRVRAGTGPAVRLTCSSWRAEIPRSWELVGLERAAAR